MGIEEDFERDWIRLNEHEMAWRAKRDSMDFRDFERSPWTVEDQNAVLEIVSFMSGAIERIEKRQAVLYRITHANLSATRKFWHSVIAAALMGFAFGIYKKLTS